MNRRPIVLLAAVLLLTALARAGEPESLKISTQEQKVIDLTNAERKKKDLPPLKPNATLFQVARAHSANMARQGKREHVLDGKNPADRVRETGYQFLRCGENIADGDAAIPVEVIMKAWMGSEGHRDNILHKDHTEIGVGIARTKNGHLYYTQVFGKPRGKK